MRYVFEKEININKNIQIVSILMLLIGWSSNHKNFLAMLNNIFSINAKTISLVEKYNLHYILSITRSDIQ